MRSHPLVLRLHLIGAVAVWVGLSSAPVFAQTHPCDSTPAGPFVIKTGQAPLIAWCHPGASGFTVQADAGPMVDVTPTIGTPNTAGLRYHEVRWTSGFQKGPHSVTVQAYVIDSVFGGRVTGPSTQIPFDVADPATPPVAPTRGRVLP